MINSGEYIPGESVNTLQSEHLKDGFDPIIACVSPGNYFIAEDMMKLQEEMEPLTEVNWFSDENDLNRDKIRNAGHETYVISPIDTSNKFSEKYMDCTGVVVVGRDIASGKDVSFLTHQKPSQFLHNHREEFVRDFAESLNEIKARCVDGSIDAVIFAGNSVPDVDIDTVKDYKDSISFLTQEILKHLNFPPVVITEPKLGGGFDNVAFYTSKRRLYVLRPPER